MAMDRELEALEKTRRHVAHITRLAGLAEEHLGEGRLEDAEAALRLIQTAAALGREGLAPLLRR